jgi:hypothetical protein
MRCRVMRINVCIKSYGRLAEGNMVTKLHCALPAKKIIKSYKQK